MGDIIMSIFRIFYFFLTAHRPSYDLCQDENLTNITNNPSRPCRRMSLSFSLFFYSVSFFIFWRLHSPQKPCQSRFTFISPLSEFQMSFLLFFFSFSIYDLLTTIFYTTSILLIFFHCIQIFLTLLERTSVVTIADKTR